MRVVVETGFGGWNADQLHHLDSFYTGLFLFCATRTSKFFIVRQQHLDNLIGDRICGVQGGQGVLHSHCDFFTTQAAVFFTLQPDKLATIKADRTVCNKARLFNQTHH